MIGEYKLHLQRKPYAAVFFVQGCLEYYRALRTLEDELKLVKLHHFSIDSTILSVKPIDFGMKSIVLGSFGLNLVCFDAASPPTGRTKRNI